MIDLIFQITLFVIGLLILYSNARTIQTHRESIKSNKERIAAIDEHIKAINDLKEWGRGKWES